MAYESKRSSSERFHYGICLNDECPKCKEKAVQKLPLRKELVCEECGKELREVPAPKKTNWKPLIIAAVALVLLIVGAVVIISTTKKAKEAPEVVAEPQQTLDTVTVVTLEPEVEPEPEVAPEPKPAPKAQGSVSYGKWTGAWKNGKPHGMGTMTYKEARVIDSRDPQKRTTAVGDYIVGEFYEGRLVQGVWYDKDNNEKGGLIIGR